MYDFTTLSPLDFEELVRDLLQAHWNRRLESFGPGRDEGIDIRHISGPERIIIQAKHYAGSGSAALRRAAAAERNKAIALKPSRYLLATSVSTTPMLKARIVEAMAGVPLAEADIMGREDLNNLLRLYPQVEQLHFKLWMASAAVLERILHSGVYNRTAAELEIVRAMIPRFVQNQSVADAETLLDQTGALIIAGAPGVGKTTLAQMLLWRHAEQGWKIFVVDDVEEALAVASSGERRLIFFDDFLGQVRLSSDHVRGLDARLPPLLTKVSAQKDLRFILTTRDYILAQAKTLSARLANSRDARSYVLNVGSYTREVKARILYNHIYFSGLATEQREAILADDFYLRMIDHKNFNPRLIEMLTRPDYLELTDQPIRSLIEQALTNPHELWNRPYRQHLSADARAVLLAMTLNGGLVGLTLLKQSFARVAAAMGLTIAPADFEERFRTAYREVEGSAIALINTLVHFTNPGLRDYLQGVIHDDRLLPLLVPQIGTVEELSETLAIYRSREQTQRQMPSPTLWQQALDRLHAAGRTNHFNYLELALDLYDLFRSEDLLARVKEAIAAFEAAGVGVDEVREACAALERSVTTVLPLDVEANLRAVVTSTVASMFEDNAASLSLEDFQSLDEALFAHGHDEALVLGTVQAAISTLARGICSDLDNCETLDQLEELEKGVIVLMEKRNVETSEVKWAIRWRREQLEETEPRSDDSERYSGGGFTSKPKMNDSDIRSMFAGLREADC